VSIDPNIFPDTSASFYALSNIPVGLTQSKREAPFIKCVRTFPKHRVVILEEETKVTYHVATKPANGRKAKVCDCQNLSHFLTMLKTREKIKLNKIIVPNK
jgi:hypothetical protein